MAILDRCRYRSAVFDAVGVNCTPWCSDSFKMFGPMQSVGHAYAVVVPAFVSAALDARPLPVHGEGTQADNCRLRKLFLGVEPACCVRASKRPSPGTAGRSGWAEPPAVCRTGCPAAGGHRQNDGQNGEEQGGWVHRSCGVDGSGVR